MDRSPLRRLAPFVALLVALVSPGLAQDGAAAPASVAADVPTEEAVDPLVAPWLGDRMVVPGDQLELEVSVLKCRRDIWVFAAEARVDGKLAASAEIMCTARDV